MARTYDNVDLIPQDEVKRANEFINTIRSLRTEITSTIPEARELAKELSRPIKDYKALTDAINRYEAAEEKLNVKMKEEARIRQELDKWRQKHIQSTGDEAKEIARLRAETERNTKAALADARAKLEQADKQERLLEITRTAEAIEKTRNENLKDGISTQQEITRTTQDLANALKQLSNAGNYDGFVFTDADGVTQYSAAINKASSDLAQLTSLQELYDEAMKNGSISVDEYNQKSRELIDLTNRITDSFGHLRDAQEESRKGFDSREYDQAADAFANLDERIKRLTIELIEDQLAIRETRQLIKNLDSDLKNNIITNDEYIARKAQLVTLEGEYSASVKNLTYLLDNETKLVNTAVGSYENLSAQYNLLKVEINRLGEEEEKEIVRKRELEEQAKRLYEQMSNLQKATGKNQLDVGKYDIAVQDLTKTVSLLDYRAGAILTKIQRVSGVKKIWLDINNKLVTSLGITAKTATFLQAAVVGLVVGGIYLAIEAYKMWREEQERVRALMELPANSLDAATLAGAQNAEKAIASLRVLYTATQDLTRSNQERLSAAEELQRLYPDYLGNLSKEEILAGGAAEAYNILTTRLIANAQARASIDKIAELGIKRLELESKQAEILNKINNTGNSILANRLKLLLTVAPSSLGFDNIGSINALVQEFSQLTEEIDATNNAISAITDSLNIDDLLQSFDSVTKNPTEKIIAAEEKARQDLALFLIKLNADTERQITQDTNKSYQDRIEALQSYIQSQEELIEARSHAQIDSVIDAAFDTGVYATREQAEQASANQIQLIYAKMWAEIAKIDEEGEKIHLSIIKDEADKQIKAIQDAAQSTIEAESDRLAELARLYNQGEISAEDYEKKKADITRQYAQERFQTEIDLLKEILELDSLSQEQREQYEKKVADAQISYNKFVNETIIKQEEDAAKERERIERELAKKREQIIRQLASSVSSIFSGLTQSRINDLDKQIDAVNEWATEESDRVARLEESGVLSKEEAEARKAAIDDEAQQRQEELQRQQVEAQRRQAIFDRGIKIAEIVWATKKAIMEAVALSPLTAGQPWAGIAAGLGVAQVAAVLAQPLPQYEDGTPKNRTHPGGPAIVGDGGRPEMVIFPSGEIFKTPATDTLMSMPKGTIVKPDWNAAVRSIFDVTREQQIWAATPPPVPPMVNNIHLKQDKMETLSRKTFQAVDVNNHLTAKLIRVTKRNTQLKKNQIN